MMTAMIIIMILRSFLGMIFKGTAHYSIRKGEEEGGKRREGEIGPIGHIGLIGQMGPIGPMRLTSSIWS
jgi:hypothetical protein